MAEPSPDEVRNLLLPWYDAHRRDLPWRRTRDPYHILVAEFLLQRTRIATGTPYFERFLARFPTVRDLAAAPLDDVLAVWEGLGFYRRARNLHAAAKAIDERFGGDVPPSYESLVGLSGIGPYTAGAIASIAFDISVPAVDGNVTRVLARTYRLQDDVNTPIARRRIREIASRLVPTVHPGTFNQALMELGATVCTPTSPACERCPLESVCLARAAGEERSLPRVRRRASVRVVRVAFGLLEADGRVLLVRRPADGLLGGLWSLPGGEVPSRADARNALIALVREQAGIDVSVLSRLRHVDRTFSHLEWKGSVYRCVARQSPQHTPTARWLRTSEALRLPLVSFHRDLLESRIP